ncbi:MAG: NAD(P)/FAD-dependent oxidoreductase [Nitrospinae bacterium]|nr:NAD(P)/FAD-dependent oxidoreductase [Nitrospinota bacterium]
MSDYDVIVIGAGIGGLTSASLLSKRGLKVLLLEQNSTAGGLCNTISKGGYHFDIGASLFWGFGHGEIFHYLFSEFNILNDLLERESVVRKIEPGLQVILPNHRVNVYSERERLYEDLKREFSSDLTNLVKLYQESDKTENEIFNLVNKRHGYSLKNHYRQDSNRLKMLYADIAIFLKRKKNILQSFNWVNREEIERFIDLQLIYFARKGLADISFPLLTTALGIPRRGIYGIRGGAGTLSGILEKQLVRYGGKITCNSFVEEIILRNGRASGVKVRTENSVNEIGAKWIIADTSISNIGDNLIKKKRKKARFSKIAKKMGHGLVPFTVLLGVDERVIPEQMGEHAIMMRDYELPPEGDNVIFVSVSPSWDETRSPQGKRCITATYFIPADESANIDWEKERGNKTEEMINFLEQLLPFVSDFVDCSYSIAPDDYSRITLRSNGIARAGNCRSDIYGFNGLSLKTPVRRLFIVGGDAFPCSGAAHTAKSGVRVAEEILRKI